MHLGVELNVSYVLARGSQKGKAIHRKLVGVSNQVQRFSVLKLGKETRIEGLLGQKRAAKVELPRHYVHVNVGSHLIQELLELIYDIINVLVDSISSLVIDRLNCLPSIDVLRPV